MVLVLANKKLGFRYRIHTLWMRSELIRTIWSEFPFPSCAEAFWWLTLARGGVDDEHAFILGGVDVGELPEQPMPLTVCWYIIESPAFGWTIQKIIQTNEVQYCVCVRDAIRIFLRWSETFFASMWNYFLFAPNGIKMNCTVRFSFVFFSIESWSGWSIEVDNSAIYFNVRNKTEYLIVSN